LLVVANSEAAGNIASSSYQTSWVGEITNITCKNRSGEMLYFNSTIWNTLPTDKYGTTQYLSHLNDNSDLVSVIYTGEYSTLMIYNTTPNDAGVYICTNGTNSTQYVIQLVVLGKFVLLSMQGNIIQGG